MTWTENNEEEIDYEVDLVEQLSSTPFSDDKDKFIDPIGQPQENLDEYIEERSFMIEDDARIRVEDSQFMFGPPARTASGQYFGISVDDLYHHLFLLQEAHELEYTVGMSSHASPADNYLKDTIGWDGTASDFADSLLHWGQVHGLTEDDIKWAQGDSSVANEKNLVSTFINPIFSGGNSLANFAIDAADEISNDPLVTLLNWGWDTFMGDAEGQVGWRRTLPPIMQDSAEWHDFDYWFGDPDSVLNRWVPTTETQALLFAGGWVGTNAIISSARSAAYRMLGTARFNQLHRAVTGHQPTSHLRGEALKLLEQFQKNPVRSPRAFGEVMEETADRTLAGYSTAGRQGLKENISDSWINKIAREIREGHNPAYRYNEIMKYVNRLDGTPTPADMSVVHALANRPRLQALTPEPPMVQPPAQHFNLLSSDGTISALSNQPTIAYWAERNFQLPTKPQQTPHPSTLSPERHLNAVPDAEDTPLFDWAKDGGPLHEIEVTPGIAQRWMQSENSPFHELHRVLSNTNFMDRYEMGITTRKVGHNYVDIDRVLGSIGINLPPRQDTMLRAEREALGGAYDFGRRDSNGEYAADNIYRLMVLMDEFENLKSLDAMPGLERQEMLAYKEFVVRPREEIIRDIVEIFDDVDLTRMLGVDRQGLPGAWFYNDQNILVRLTPEQIPTLTSEQTSATLNDLRAKLEQARGGQILPETYMPYQPMQHFHSSGKRSLDRTFDSLAVESVSESGLLRSIAALEDHQALLVANGMMKKPLPSIVPLTGGYTGNTPLPESAMSSVNFDNMTPEESMAWFRQNVDIANTLIRNEGWPLGIPPGTAPALHEQVYGLREVKGTGTAPEGIGVRDIHGNMLDHFDVGQFGHGHSIAPSAVRGEGHLSETNLEEARALFEETINPTIQNSYYYDGSPKLSTITPEHAAAVREILSNLNLARESVLRAVSPHFENPQDGMLLYIAPQNVAQKIIEADTIFSSGHVDYNQPRTEFNQTTSRDEIRRVAEAANYGLPANLPADQRPVGVVWINPEQINGAGGLLEQFGLTGPLTPDHPAWQDMEFVHTLYGFVGQTYGNNWHIKNLKSQARGAPIESASQINAAVFVLDTNNIELMNNVWIGFGDHLNEMPMVSPLINPTDADKLNFALGTNGSSNWNDFPEGSAARFLYWIMRDVTGAPSSVDLSTSTYGLMEREYAGSQLGAVDASGMPFIEAAILGGIRVSENVSHIVMPTREDSMSHTFPRGQNVLTSDQLRDTIPEARNVNIFGEDPPIPNE